jgi:hypothetical protein
MGGASETTNGVRLKCVSVEAVAEFQLQVKTEGVMVYT